MKSNYINMKEGRVAIIGGEGAMGKMTNRLFQNIGYETVVSDIKSVDSPTPFEAIQGSNIVFFSVLPIDEIPKIISAASKVLSPANIILDNASVKKPIEAALKNLDDRGISACSTHPLCAPGLDLTGEKVLVMDVGPYSMRARSLAENLYASANMDVIPFQFPEHDNRMAIMQMVPHFVMRAVGEVLSNNNLNMKDLWTTATANFQLFLLSLGRVTIQNPQISQALIKDLLETDFGKQFEIDFSLSVQNLLDNRNNMADSFLASSETLLDQESRQETIELTNNVIKGLKRKNHHTSSESGRGLV
ncbi:MAG TPA: prephenate dehydrogenase/arogenate dehydrogenase family protein [Patescibacteria group bacterium]|nr:prephenate dehydrogenase/arogenate dehydrogenase family protein [Patescibacteria group bacterium]